MQGDKQGTRINLARPGARVKSSRSSLARRGVVAALLLGVIGLALFLWPKGSGDNSSQHSVAPTATVTQGPKPSVVPPQARVKPKPKRARPHPKPHRRKVKPKPKRDKTSSIRITPQPRSRYVVPPAYEPPPPAPRPKPKPPRIRVPLPPMPRPPDPPAPDE
jgi:hypothetical protein